MSKTSSLTTTGKIRSTLAEAMAMCVAGGLSQEDGRNLIGLGNQITNSISAELKHLQLHSALGLKTSEFGALDIG
jgi:hypothetical protein